MTLGEIISNYRGENQISMDEFAKRAGLSKGYISMLEKNKNPRNNKPIIPSMDTIWKVACAMNMELDEIFPMLDKDLLINISGIEKEIGEFDQKILSDFHELDIQGQHAVQSIMKNELIRVRKQRELENRILELQRHIDSISSAVATRVWPYYGKNAAAGKSIVFSDVMAGTKEYPITDENRSADFTIGVSGNSMEPTFSGGDIVFVKSVEHMDIGDIGIFRRADEVYIKELGDGILISHNESYEPIKLNAEFVCIGKVIGKVE